MNQQTVDPYTRTMVELFNEKKIIAVSTGFQAFFGRSETASKTVFSPDKDTVDIDIIRGNQKTAALVPRGIQTKILGDLSKTKRTQRYTNFSRVFPLCEEEGAIEAQKLLSRRAGEDPYTGGITRAQRLQLDAAEQNDESIRRIVRLHERLAAQSVMDGVQDAILGTSDTDLQYDWVRKATHEVALSTKWDTATPDIMGDIDTACQLIEQDGHAQCDFMGLGQDVTPVFIADTTVQSLADNRNFNLIRVGPDNPVPERFMRFVKAGWVPRGVLNTPVGRNIWMFTYTRGYTNESGTFVNYMPTKEVVFWSSEARNDRYFGPSDTLPLEASDIAWYNQTFGFSPVMPPMPANILGDGMVMPEMFHFDAYMPTGRKLLVPRVQSAPIYPTTQTDAFVVYTAVVS